MKRRDLIAELDRETRRLVFEREMGRCFVCGAQGHDPAHLFSRRNLATRWDRHEKGNVHVLCRTCHDLDHGGLLSPSYQEVFVSRFGEDVLMELASRAASVARWLDGELLLMLHDMRCERV